MSTSRKSENSTCECSNSSEHTLCSQSCNGDDCYYINASSPLGIIPIPGSGALKNQNSVAFIPQCPRDQQDIADQATCISDCCDFFSAYNTTQFWNGDLIIKDSSLTSLINVFSELLIINGNLYIIDTQYTSITGFNKLRTVTGSIVFANNTKLTTIPTFPSLLTVSGKIDKNAENAEDACKQGAIVVVNNKVLRKIIGFESLRQVKWGIFIADNACLTHICGFLHLYRTDYIIISNNCRLNKITGFCYTALVGESLLILDNNISSNDDLIINAFLTLESVSSLVIIGNKYLRKLEFNALRQICCCFAVRSNPQLESLCSSIKRASSIKIEKNDSLIIICFPELEEISCGLFINKNGALEKLDTFDELKRIGHVLMISENKQLHQLKGFCKIKFIGSCCVHDNNNKTDLPKICDPQTNCCPCVFSNDNIIPPWTVTFSIVECVVTDNLENAVEIYDDACDACEYELPSLFFQLACFRDARCEERETRTNFINTDFSIIIYGNPRLRCIDGFDCLRHLESSLFIINNASLTVIEAFPHLASGLDIWIRNNPSLKYIKGFNHLLSIRNFIVKESTCLNEFDSLKKLQFAQYIQIVSKFANSVKLSHAPIPSILGEIDYYSY